MSRPGPANGCRCQMHMNRGQLHMHSTGAVDAARVSKCTWHRPLSSPGPVQLGLDLDQGGTNAEPEHAPRPWAGRPGPDGTRWEPPAGRHLARASPRARPPGRQGCPPARPGRRGHPRQGRGRASAPGPNLMGPPGWPEAPRWGAGGPGDHKPIGKAGTLSYKGFVSLTISCYTTAPAGRGGAGRGGAWAGAGRGAAGRGEAGRWRGFGHPRTSPHSQTKGN